MIKIVTDSTVQLSEEEINEYGISIIPLNVIIDGETFLDNITITKDEFLTKMETSEELPSTSQPSPGTYVELYDEIGKDGDEILSIHVNGDLSGTYNSAVQAADITSSNVTTYDSKFVDRPLGFFVLTAAKMAKEGHSMESIIEALDKLRETLKMYVAVIHIDNLIKGGRIGSTMGKIGKFINLKLVLEWTKNGLDVDTKGRGIKSINKRFNQVIDIMKESGPLQEIGFSHAGLTDLSEEWIQTLKENFPGVPILIRQLSPVLMAHSGKEAFAISYLPK